MEALDKYEQLVMWLLKERAANHKGGLGANTPLPPLPFNLEELTSANRDLTGSSSMPVADDLLPGRKSMLELEVLQNAAAEDDDLPAIPPPDEDSHALDPDSPIALYCIPSSPSNAPIIRVLPHASSLNQSDVFVLHVPDSELLFQFNGSRSAVVARGRALDLTRAVNGDAHGGAGEVVLVPSHPGVASDQDYIEFIRHLLPDTKVAYTKSYPPPEISKSTPPLSSLPGLTLLPIAYRVSLTAEDELELELIEDRPLSRGLLAPTSAILIDTGSTGIVFAWLGKEATPTLRQTAVSCGNHLLASQERLDDSNADPVDRPPWASVSKVSPGLEPYLFTQFFPDWGNDTFAAPSNRDPDAVQISRGEKASDRVASVTSRDIDVVQDMHEGASVGGGKTDAVTGSRNAAQIAALNLDPNLVPGILSVMVMEGDEYPFGLPDAIAADGHFFDSDAHIVILYYESLPASLTSSSGSPDDPSSGGGMSIGKGCVVFFWLGMFAEPKLWLAFKHSSLWKSLTESGLNPCLIKVEQGDEPPALVSLFRGLITIHHGHASRALPASIRKELVSERPGLTFAERAMSASPRMFRVHGFNEFNMAVHEVALSPDALTSTDTFLLYDPCMQSPEPSVKGVPPAPGPGTGGAFIFRGRGSTTSEGTVVEILLERISDLFNPTPDHDARQPWFDLTEDTADPDALSAFASYFGVGEDQVLEYHRHEVDPSSKKYVRLFEFSIGSGFLTVQPAPQVYPSLLSEPRDVFLLDGLSELYLYLGRDARISPPLLENLASVVAQYVEATPFDRPVSSPPIVLLSQPGRSSPFSSLPPLWKNGGSADVSHFHAHFPVWWGLPASSNAMAQQLSTATGSKEFVDPRLAREQSLKAEASKRRRAVRDAIRAGTCTYLVTGDDPSVVVDWFECFDCNQVACFSCRATCHASHRLSSKKRGLVVCGCRLHTDPQHDAPQHQDQDQ